MKICVLVAALAASSMCGGARAADWVTVPGSDWEYDRDSVQSNIPVNRGGVPVKPFEASDADGVQKNQVSADTRNSAMGLEGTIDVYCSRGVFFARSSVNNWQDPAQRGPIAASPMARVLAPIYCP